MVLQGRSVAVALPLEEVPLPAAQALRAVVEQLLGAADVAGGQLAPRQGNPPQVRGLLLALEGRALLAQGRALLAQGSALLPQGGRDVAEADHQSHERDGQDHRRRHDHRGHHGPMPPRPLAGALQVRRPLGPDRLVLEEALEIVG